MIIDGTTRLVGILADPIAHVRTPQMFNQLTAARGVGVVCVPVHVTAAELERFLAGADAIENLLGFIVTMPHKERVTTFCGDLTGAARIVGAANALRRDRATGQWVGGNFDGAGFVAGLAARGHDLRGRRVLLLGAGGAGKSIAYAVAGAGPAELVIQNRSPARAELAAEQIARARPGVTVRAGGDDATGFDVVVNATSLGLRDDDALPLDPSSLAAGTLVCEAVMRDGDTALLAAARRRGCVVHDGHHMLAGQITEIADFLGV